MVPQRSRLQRFDDDNDHTCDELTTTHDIYLLVTATTHIISREHMERMLLVSTEGMLMLRSSDMSIT
jgi:hypothetical protein